MDLEVQIMATNNEIEFKQLQVKMYTINLNILFEDKEPFIQINHYIDTPNFTLRDHKCITNPS